MTQQAPSKHTGNELLREMVIGVGFLAMVLGGVGALYSMQSSPDEAAAGTAAGTAVAATSPAPAETPKPKVTVPEGTVMHADVYFDFKSTRLRAEAAKMLQDRAAAMARTETWTVLVTGYADRQGPPVYNRALAQRRADTVKQFLVELGVPESSVRVVALGPEAALCDDASKECQQLNRRVHLEIRRLGPATTALAPADDDVQQP